MDTIKRDPELLLHEIEAFLVRVGMNPTEFGLQVKNDGALVSRLRAGKDVRTGTASEIRRFMENYKPPLANASAKRAASGAAHI